ncbi:hypothetical protein FB451DRAFT_1387792 [Mycena latifolia]|nr:hypothetical protein FB451DRAFT_1387792 [Mycena latifolia]
MAHTCRTFADALAGPLPWTLSHTNAWGPAPATSDARTRLCSAVRKFAASSISRLAITLVQDYDFSGHMNYPYDMILTHLTAVSGVRAVDMNLVSYAMLDAVPYWHASAQTAGDRWLFYNHRLASSTISCASIIRRKATPAPLPPDILASLPQAVIGIFGTTKNTDVTKMQKFFNETMPGYIKCMTRLVQSTMFATTGAEVNLPIHPYILANHTLFKTLPRDTYFNLQAAHWSQISAYPDGLSTGNSLQSPALALGSPKQLRDLLASGTQGHDVLVLFWQAHCDPLPEVEDWIPFTMGLTDRSCIGYGFNLDPMTQSALAGIPLYSAAMPSIIASLSRCELCGWPPPDTALSDMSLSEIRAIPGITDDDAQRIHAMTARSMETRQTQMPGGNNARLVGDAVPTRYYTPIPQTPDFS